MTTATEHAGIGDATFDATGRYRYHLWRAWPMLGGQGDVAFIMLNPSTASASENDPTIRRCIRFAQAWGFAKLHVGNLFAFRATDPRALLTAGDPVGPDNDRALLEIASRCGVVVAAWGIPARTLFRRSSEVLGTIGAVRRWSALGLTKNGCPRHPLYVPAATKPGWLRYGASGFRIEPWEPKKGAMMP